MTETPDKMIETPLVASPSTYAASAIKADLLSEMLSHVRLSGAVFLKGVYSTPWALESPGPRELVELLAPGAQRLILFHIIREGRAQVTAANARVELEAGDVAILPHARQHQLGSPELAVAVPIASLLPTPPWDSVPILEFGGGGAPTNIVCGYFLCDELLYNSVLRHLPEVFRVRPTKGAAADWITASIGFALDQSPGGRLGHAMLMARLPELLLMEALRLYSEQHNVTTGWLAAISDPIVSRALGLLHAEPAHEWSVEELAQRAATSRSVLGERFRALLGQSPIHYLIEWRMQLAAGLLRTTPLKLAEIAERSGYGSEAAFSRAFQRHLGMPPALWRDKGLPSLG
jgi:AraC-like DNA-binding protein